jgi:hypothetical protein
MSIVNNILNMVKLNTTDYNKKLQKMRKDTKKSTKDIGSSFSSMASAWKAALVGIASAGLVTAVKSELMSTEKAVAGFISSMGGVSEARAQFEMLQQAARDTLQPFEALQSATMNLRKNGIQPSAETLKAFSQIAYGTGQSLDAVSQAFTGALNGRLKSLQQLGIVAKDQGSQLILTYKGVGTAVDKNAESLHDYFQTIGKENEGVLDYLQSGMTGAVNHIDNAWGDFVRSIAESGLGQAIADTVRVGANALDGFTKWINDNQQSIRQFFARWSDYIKQLGNDFQDLQRDMLSWFETSNKINGKQTDSSAGFLGWVRSMAQTAGEKYYELFNGSDAERAYRAEKDRLKKLFEQRVATLKKGSAEYTAEIEKFNQSVVDLERKFSDKQTTVVGRVGQFFNLQDTANKLQKNLDEYEDYLEKQDKLREEKRKKFESVGVGGDVLSFTQYQEASKTGKAVKESVDRWSSYYEKIKDIAKSSLSDVQKLHLEHEQKIAELEKEYSQSRLATESEYLDARKILDDDYFRQYQDLEKQAQQFMAEINGDELIQLQDSYREKLEMLEQYHEDSLISEEDYLNARNKLYDDYTTEMNKIDKSKRQGMLSDADIENLNSFHDAMDSMSDAFGNLTQGLSETSSSYKALFAIQKSFAVASATVKAALAWMTALSGASTWYEAVANYATAISMTTGVIAQLRSVSMHDKGGFIGAGQLGIVGEYGPELVRGPASVTSRQKTADLARSAISGNAVTVNLYENRDRAGTVDQRQGRDGESIIDIFVSNIRRGGQIAQTMESTYQLKRYGA